jgi:hypothetical protein
MSTEWPGWCFVFLSDCQLSRESKEAAFVNLEKDETPHCICSRRSAHSGSSPRFEMPALHCFRSQSRRFSEYAPVTGGEQMLTPRHGRPYLQAGRQRFHDKTSYDNMSSCVLQRCRVPVDYSCSCKASPTFCTTWESL